MDNGRKEAVTAVDFDSNGGGLKVFDMWKKLYDSGYFEDYEQQQQIPDSILLRTGWCDHRVYRYPEKCS